MIYQKGTLAEHLRRSASDMKSFDLAVKADFNPHSSTEYTTDGAVIYHPSGASIILRDLNWTFRADGTAKEDFISAIEALSRKVNNGHS